MRVSIAMAAFNGSRYLPEQLNSYVCQTVRPYELVVSDDNSSDNTLALVTEFARRAPFLVRSYTNPNGRGVFTNFAKALTHCDGDIILLSDQDDLWMPNKIERIVREFEQEPRILAVASNSEQIDAEGRLRGVNTWRDAARLGEARLRRWHRDPLRVFLSYRAIHNAHGLAVSRRLRDICLPVQDADSYARAFRQLDSFLFVTASLLGGAAFVYEALTLHRRHGGNTSTLERRSNAVIARQHQSGRTANRVEQLALAVEHLRRRGIPMDGDIERRVAALLCHYGRALDAQRRGIVGLPGLFLLLLMGSYARHAKPFRSFLADCVAALARK